MNPNVILMLAVLTILVIDFVVKLYKAYTSPEFKIAVLDYRRGAITLQGVMSTLLGIMFLAYTLPEMVTAVQSVNTTAWNFTGHSGAGALWGLILLVVIAKFVQKVFQ